MLEAIVFGLVVTGVVFTSLLVITAIVWFICAIFDIGSPY